MGVNNATACYRELGAELTRLRKAKGMTGDDIARRAAWTRTKVGRMETGYADSSVVDVIHYVVLCGLTLPQAADILELARIAERKQGYWLSDKRIDHSLRSLIFHESSARLSISYEPLLVPGLLQTPAYASARIAGEPGMASTDVKAALRTRMERQRILRWVDAAQFTFFVHEQALRLQIGSPAIMQEQLLQLVLTVAALDNVTMRVVPSYLGERSAFGGPFRVLEYTEHRPLVYLDHTRGGLILEDRQYVEDYTRLLPELSAVSLDAGQSRSFTAALADEYDRGSQPDAAHHVEEKQL